jgi:GMP synthase-like glutamine amidotransferase
MNILLIDNGSTYITELKSLLGKHIITHVKMNSASVSDASHYDLIILSGGHSYSVVNHEHLYAQELEIIRKSNRPILGVCLGFELIAHAFGGKLNHIGKSVHGLRELNFEANSSLMSNFNVTTFQVFESHKWAVESVPDILEVLASSSDGIEIVQHVLKPIIGFQFHPEVNKKYSLGDEIFKFFFDQIEDRVNAE